MWCVILFIVKFVTEAPGDRLVDRCDTFVRFMKMPSIPNAAKKVLRWGRTLSERVPLWSLVKPVYSDIIVSPIDARDTAFFDKSAASPVFPLRGQWTHSRGTTKTPANIPCIPTWKQTFFLFFKIS